MTVLTLSKKLSGLPNSWPVYSSKGGQASGEEAARPSSD
jgi:hypothetical protein